MTEQRQCKLCLDYFEATTENFYRTEGRWLTRQCKRCLNTRSIERNKLARKAKREGIISHRRQTPSAVVRTPEYTAYRSKLRQVEKRYYAARKNGHVNSAKQLEGYITTMRRDWYQKLEGLR